MAACWHWACCIQLWCYVVMLLCLHACTGAGAGASAGAGGGAGGGGGGGVFMVLLWCC